MRSVQFILQDEQRPQRAQYASARGKEVPQVHPVWSLKRQCVSSENPHAGSYWGEAFCLHTLQLLLKNSW